MSEKKKGYDDTSPLNRYIETVGETKNIVEAKGAYHLDHGKGDEKVIVHVWLNRKQVFTLLQQLALSVQFMSEDKEENYSFYGQLRWIAEDDD